ncbi:VOC family protein [Tessaracoccus coleopterorum]|uniref:VOC family protein n=1 Tax=Tessaracoccus coleopterorum TaxID=2714950 RepID=UPI001E2E470B|nr:VOC family protein [Tessaracoccus coleopterorum]
MAHGDITHIDIPVGDMAKASAFYSELFGWQIAEVPGFEGYPMWQAPNKISGGGLAPRDAAFTQPAPTSRWTPSTRCSAGRPRTGPGS